jgi:hypothetical protein
MSLSLAGGRAHDQADFVPGSAVHMEDLGLHEKVDAFVTENPLHLVRDVGILTTHGCPSLRAPPVRRIPP